MTNKIQTLSKIVKEYSKYFIYFDDAKVFNLGLKFAIRFYNRTNPKNYPEFTRRFPIDDIDTIIKRYRSKLDYGINKHIKECMKNRVCQKRFKIPYHLYKINM